MPVGLSGLARAGRELTGAMAGSSTALQLGTTRPALLAVLFVLVSMPQPHAAAKSRRPGQRDVVFSALWLKNCDENVPARFGELTLRPQANGGQFVDVDMNVTKPIQYARSMSIKIEKCKDRVSSTTCEYFGTFHWRTNVCDLVFKPRMIWTTVIHSISPRMQQCPVKEGLYSARNASWDFNTPFAKEMGLVGYLWTGVLTIRDPSDAVWLCAVGAMRADKPRPADA